MNRFPLLISAALLLLAVSLPRAHAAAPASQNFDAVVAGTVSPSNGSLTLSGVVYSTDAVNDQLAVDTIANVTGSMPSLGSGNGLSSVWVGTNTGTYLRFASVNPADNFKLVSFNAQVFGHSSHNSEIYTIKGYDNGVEQATATVNFRASGTYGTGASTLAYTRLTTPLETLTSNDGSNCGTLSLTGTAWRNIDEVRMIVADTSPNTIFTVAIDQLEFAAPVAPATTTDLAGNSVSNIPFATGETYIFTPVSPPVISSGATAGGTYGSSTFSYTITASNTPTSFAAVGLPPGLSLDASSGQITGTPTAVTGSPFSVTIKATNASGTGSADLTITINKKSLLVSGITAGSKVYDGTTGAVLNLTNPTLTGKVAGDDLSLVTENAVGTFANRNVGTAKSVTITGITLTGAAAVNYNNPTVLPTSASITAAALTVTADRGQAKTVGESDPAFSYSVTSGALANGDALTGALARAAGETAGTYTITQGTLSAGSNYALTFVSADFTINPAAVAPTISLHPQSTAVAGTASTTFTVAATGTEPLTYQWFQDNNPLAGQTSSSLVLPFVLLKDAGSYHAVVTNDAGSAPSHGATLTVQPYVLNSSPDRSVGLGGKHTFVVTAAASGNLTYQWQKDGHPIRGATDATYAIAAATLADAGSYDVVVGHDATTGTKTSPAAALTVLPNPQAYLATTSIATESGVTAFFSIEGTQPKQLVIAAYGPALTSVTNAIVDPQILVEDASGALVAKNDNWGTIEDTSFAATYARLQLTPLGSGSKDAVVFTTLPAGSYRVRIAGVDGTTGTVGLAIADAELNPPSRLAYVALRGPVSPGAPLTGGFTVVNSADKKLLLRAVGPSLVSGGHADPVLTVFDSDGSTVVTKNDNWAGDSSLASAFAQAGAFNLPANSTDAAILGAMRIGTGSYTAQITAAAGTGDVLWEIYDLADAAPATFAPIVVVQPANVSATGGSVSFIAKAVGGGTLTYQWRKGGENIAQATGAMLLLNSITSADIGSYDVVVSSSASTATATSTPANLHLISSIASVMGPASGSYNSGDALNFTVTLTGAVTVTGTPRLALTIGSSTVYANYNATASTATALVFSYNVTAGDTDTDGIASTSILELNGGTIRDAADNNVTRTFTAPTTTGVLVDTTSPAVTIGAPSVVLAKSGPVTFTVTYSDHAFDAATLTTAGITLNKTGTADASIAVSGTRDTRTVTLSSITGDGSLGISLAAGTATDVAGNLALAAGPSTTFAVDNTPPALAISSISGDDRLSLTEAGAVLTISGTTSGAEDNTTVTVTLNGQSYTGTVSANAWSATVPATAVGALAEQTHTVSATVSDLAGNASTSATRTLTVDRTPPTIAIAAVSGDDRLGAIEAASALTISGTTSGAEDNRVVNVVLNHQSYTGTVTANAWSVTVAATAIGALPEQTHTISATVSDLSGNPATPATRTLAVDKTAPTISIATISTDDRLSATEAASSLALSGATTDAEDGRTVTVMLNSQSYTASVSSNAWSVTVPAHEVSALAEQTYTVKASVADFTGNSATPATRTLTIDKTAPTVAIAAISTDDRLNAVESASALTISGTTTGTEDNRNVTVTLNHQTYSGTVTANAWSISIPTTSLAVLADQANTIAADVADLAGNAATTATRTFTVDKTAPAAPLLVAISDDTGDSATDHITSDTTLSISGTAEAGSTVTLTRVGNSLLGTSPADATTGAWSYDYTATALASGEHSFTAIATDAAGNASATSAALIVTVDTATAAPVIVAFDGNSGSTADAITNDTTLVLSGTAEPNSLVTLTRSSIIGAIGTARANQTGEWTFDYGAGTTLTDGTYVFNASIVDIAGNPSTTSADFPVTVDTSAPAAPVIVALAKDTGSSDADRVTSDATLVLSGTAEAGALISLKRADLTGDVGTATADAITGEWSFDYSSTVLPDGVYGFTATATDAASNVSAASAEFAVTIDTIAPVISSDSVASATYKSAFTFNVTATGAATDFTATGLPAGLVLASATGEISGAATQSGVFNVVLTATDAAGNTVAGSLTLTVNPANLTVAGVAAGSRIYDSTTVATLDFAGATLVGVAGTDAVMLVTGHATGAFADKAIGAAKTVTVSGLTLAGADAVHYTLTQPTTTASIDAGTLTVTGATASSKIYDGTTAAQLSFTGASLVGAAPRDAVTLVANHAVGTFASANVGPRAVAISGLALSGADAGNYVLTPPVASATIAPAAVIISLSNLNHVYDGTVKQATANSTPGVALGMTYSNTPVAAGSYTATASSTDANYSGSASATLTIAKATQTVTFAAPASASPGVAVALSASASSGLPVTFSVVGGSGSIAGSSVTLTGASVTVRATQPGNVNYEAASAEQTIGSESKLAQTISFPPISNHNATDAAFALNATASSGLPVSFTVLGGPATLNGSTLTLTGAAGAVTVRASQAGSALYEAAPDVTQSFNVLAVGHQVFFGLTQNQDTVAIDLAPDGQSGTLLCYIGATGEAFIVIFTVNADGSFDAIVAPLGMAGEVSAVSGNGPSRAHATVSRTFHGQLIGNMITGSIAELGLSFTATLQPSNGPTASIAGLYESKHLNSSAGSTASIVGTEGQVLVIASTATLTTGGMGAVATDGTFTAQTPDATIIGEVDAPTTTVSGTILVPNQPAVSFSGLGSNTLRTDRLINLSSRVRVGPLAGRTLITGFVIGGIEPKRLLLRAVGPALTRFGVNDALGNPRLEIYNGAGTLVLRNDDWSGADTAAAFAQVGAFSLDAGTRDAALLTTLQPGAYTMHVVDGGEMGVALAEIYDASPNPQGEYQRLINISSRGTVEAGEGVLIGGFVVTGNSPKKVLVRGVGPSLGAFGVADTLADPSLTIHSGSTVIAQNDDWGTPAAVTSAQIAASAVEIAEAARVTGAFAFANGTKDAAILVTLAPGAYTAQVNGTNGATGVALVEIYELPE